MQPLSNDCHKALLSVGGTTILGRIVDALLRIEVTRVVVVTGYRAEDIRAYLTSRYPAVEVQFVENARWADTNNIVSLDLGLEHIEPEADVVLVECDLLFDETLLDRIARPDQGNVALVDRYRDGMDGTVVSVVDGVVTEVFPPHAQREGFDFDGKYKTLNIYRFASEFCSNTLKPLLDVYAARIDSNAYYELVLGALANIPSHRIRAEVVTGALWAEVDDPNDLAAARFLFEPESRSGLLDRAQGGTWHFDVTSFAYMQNAHFPTRAMIAAMQHALPRLLGAYSSSAPVLAEKLSWLLGCDASRLVVLDGASQAFPILRDQLRGARVAIPSPTFGEYGRMFPKALRYEDRPGFDADEIEELAGSCDVLVVVSPNNPTGTTVRTAAIADLARRNPSTIVLLDESFVPFSDQPSLLTVLEGEPIDNVAILASLGKVLGVPGLRLGYLYTRDPSFHAEFSQRVPIWNISSPAEFLLELLLKFRPELESAIAQTVADRERLRRQLEGLDGVVEIAPSGGNFLLVTLHGGVAEGAALRRHLLAEHTIDVKDVSERFRDHRARIRVGIRSMDENDLLVRSLGEALAR